MAFVLAKKSFKIQARFVILARNFYNKLKSQPLLSDFGRIVVKAPVLGGFSGVSAHGVNVAVDHQDNQDVDEYQVNNRRHYSTPSCEHCRIGEVEVDDPTEVKEHEENQN